MSNGISISVPLHRIEIYTDGGCEPNPGPGGYGAVLLHPKKWHEVSGGFRLTTNNRMEIYAAIVGLQLFYRDLTNFNPTEFHVLRRSDGQELMRVPIQKD